MKVITEPETIPAEELAAMDEFDRNRDWDAAFEEAKQTERDWEEDQ